MKVQGVVLHDMAVEKDATFDVPLPPLGEKGMSGW